jgi:hypothetical protein
VRCEFSQQARLGSEAILFGVSRARTALAIAVVTISVAFTGASAQSAGMESAGRCSSGAIHVVIAGRHRCLRWGLACRSRFNSTYHRYLFNCSGGFLAFWWTGLTRRPLHIPMLETGGICPATVAEGTLGERGNLDVPAAPAFGPGPAYPALGSEGGLAVLTYLAGWGYEGWDGTKLLWTVPRYDGPYIVRGRQLDGPNELQFDQGPNWSNKLHDELRLVGSYTRLNPAATFLRAPGCYAYQVDGRGFSYLIVFKARIVSPR